MLDFVPLARARWEMTDVNAQVERIGKALELLFPDTRAVAATAAGIGRDEQFAGPRVNPWANPSE